MKSKFILPAAMLLLLASCGGGTTPTPSTTAEPSSQSSQASSESSVAPTFEATTLSAIHDARVAKTLPTLEGKNVTIKGKVTFAKRVSELYNSLVIQDGKNAIEVDYPEPFSVNVGDAVEVKGCLKTSKVGDFDSIWVSTYAETVPGASITVINEAITVETVTITKASDLVEFEASQSSITFSVTGNRKNAAFIGKLPEGNDEYIVSNKLGIADKFDEAPYAEGDSCRYTGVFTYSSSSDAKVIRYFDKEGFAGLK
ncbi:MAG: hypothetical protein II467_05240 [Bacilli bacterium]|nr:hypothetical protein [Bacilli bacterium]